MMRCESEGKGRGKTPAPPVFSPRPFPSGSPIPLLTSFPIHAPDVEALHGTNTRHAPRFDAGRRCDAARLLGGKLREGEGEWREGV